MTKFTIKVDFLERHEREFRITANNEYEAMKIFEESPDLLNDKRILTDATLDDFCDYDMERESALCYEEDEFGNVIG